MKIKQPEQVVGCVNPGNWSMLKIQVPGEDILAEDWNAEFLNVIANANPAGLASAAVDAASMRETLNPYPSASLVIPDSLCEELRMYRYVINKLAGTQYWYESADTTGKTVVTGGDLHNHLGTDVDPVNGGGALIGTDAIEDHSITRIKLAEEVVNDSVVQIVSDIYRGTSSQLTDNIPHDDTIPQISEGFEVLSLTITPKNIGNIIRLNGLITYQRYDVLTYITSALFIDGASNAVDAVSCGDGEAYNQLSMRYEWEATDTNPHIFSIRVGTNNSSFWINPLFSGITGSYLQATEYYKGTS